MFTVDMHNDFLEEVCKIQRRNNERFWNPQVAPLTSYYEKYKAGEVFVNLSPISGDSMVHDCDPLKVMAKIDHVKRQISSDARNFAVATCAGEIDAAYKAGKVSLVLMFEGCRALQGETYLLRTFYELGVRVAALTWNHRNELGYGVGEKHDGGLSRIGKELVREMNRLGMMVDVSHASYQTTMDTLEVSTGTVIASHSNARAVFDHKRNLSDEQIKAIADQDGLIGVVFYPYLVSAGDPTLDDIANHIEHIAGVAGIDHVGLGSDFIDCFPYEWISSVLGLEGLEIRGKIKYPDGLADARGFPNLAKKLAQRGFSHGDVEKVMGQNFMNAFRKVCG